MRVDELLGIGVKSAIKARGYGLGERNPKTQVYGARGYETEDQDAQRSAEWAGILADARSGRLPRKYHT